MNKKNIVFTALMISLILALTWLGAKTYKAYEFNINCGDYLKRAADAATIELAKQELDTALHYMEKNNLTHGVVSIFLHQPQNDIGFWYENIKMSRDELNNIDPNASQLEKSNILLKLRETLIDNSKRGEIITCPNDICVYPWNILCFWWGILSWLSVLFFFTWFVILDGV